MFRIIVVVISLVSLVSACSKDRDPSQSIIDIVADSSTNLVSLKEKDYRPAYHFTPASKWMNDPNGMVFYKGKYHLFYQYNPNSSVWGPMHWAHATSTDLFNWQDHDIALYPENFGTIFSGSAVVDVDNTSGFKTGVESPLVAIYTIAGTQQHQGLAYSSDAGFNWTKFPSNPVLPNPGVADFRDPKVVWHKPSQKWIMSLAVGNKISFYSSANLKSWTYESSFGTTEGAHGGVWECPDLFELPVEGASTSKWVLLVSLNPGGPNGGSATQYFVGEFDGKNFTTASSQTQWLDYGTDNYAGVTYDNISAEDGRRILVGWMSNWSYAQDVPTYTWRSTMTIPRVLRLRQAGQGFLLKSNPVSEISQYTAASADTSVSQPQNRIQLNNNKAIKSGSYVVDLKLDLNEAANAVLSIGNSSEKLLLTIDKASKQLVVDRSSSGHVQFSSHFRQNIVCPFELKSTGLTALKIFVDKTSIEVFMDEGERAVSCLFFPVYQYNTLKLNVLGDSKAVAEFSLKEIRKSVIR